VVPTGDANTPVVAIHEAKEAEEPEAEEDAGGAEPEVLSEKKDEGSEEG